MLEKNDHVKRIQEITFEAYKSSGRIAALLDQNTGPSEQLSEELERVAAQIEHGAIELRNLCIGLYGCIQLHRLDGYT